MADIKINIINLDSIRRAFELSPRLMTIELSTAIKQAIFTIGRRSRMNTPVDTGRLRASHYENFAPMKGELGTNTDYDMFVHEGTKFMVGRPYLANAVNQSQGEVDQFFTAAVQRVLNQIAKIS